MRVDHKFEVRALQDRDLSSLTELYKNVFNVEKDESFWRWKYFSLPAGEHIMKVAIESKSGKVIGQVGTIPVQMALDGRKVLGTQTWDVVVLPEYQKGGPFFKLSQLVIQESGDRGALFIFGFSITKTLKLSTRFLKFKSVFPIRRLVRVLQPSHFISQKIKMPWVSFILGEISGRLMRFIYSDQIPLPEGYRLHQVSSFDERYDRLMESLAVNTKIMVYKDSKYLNWRYIDCPSHNYKVFAVESAEEIAGFTVVSIQNEDIRRAYILELIADPQKPRMLEALLNQAIRYSYDSKADTINSWAPEHSLAWKIKRKKGFVVKETLHNLIVRPLLDEEALLDLTDAPLWDISMGDSDYV